MKAFAFSLQKYMDVKKDDEELLTKKLKNIDNIISDIKSAIKDCNSQEASEKTKMNSEYEKGLAAQDLHKYSAFFDYLYEVRTHRKKELQDQMAEKEECRQQLIRVMNEVKALDKMKERQYEDYMEGVRQEENKAVDDFVSYQAFSS